MGVLTRRLVALFVLALPASCLLISGSRQEGAAALPEDVKDCLRGKTVFLAGNSITRGLYFTLGAMLLHGNHHDNSTAMWRDREAQKWLCQGGPLGLLSCRYDVQALDTRLVMSMTQRLDEFVDQLKRASKKVQPDIVIVEIGLDHITGQYDVDGTGAIGFERNIDEEFENVAHAMEHMHGDFGTKFLWRAVSHFNESSAWNKAWTNKNVDRWNQKLFEHFQARNFLEAEWFRYTTSTAELIDLALQKKDGWGMEDWVHPNAETMAQLVREVAPNLCF